MLSWTPYPFIRIVFFFCAGIVGGIYFPELDLEFGIWLFGISASLYFLISFLKSRNRFKSVNPGVIGLIIIFLGGYIQVYNLSENKKDDHFIHDGPLDYYQAIAVKQAEEKENSWKVVAEVKAVNIHGQWRERIGKVLLYFSKKDFPGPCLYGDVLLIKGNPKLLKGPANPGEFDYSQFLAFRQIYHQHFLRKDDAILIDHQSPNFLIDYSIRARVWASDALHRFVKGKREQATATALVLGVTDGLDNDLIGAYAATGSLHVLSVSGLHVGIIYWMILLFLKPLNNSTTGKWILAILSIGVLWMYAFVTGLSPSVLRAVTMFSFVAVARPWSRRTNIYNTLGASAFCLLMYDPFMIMSVGFQLSYLAVIGIVYFQPIFSRLWEPKSLLWDNIWQITSVSVAAQLATFALGLFYFHQFPVYFLLSNLFVIPLSFVVLVLGIVLIAVSAFSFLGTGVGFLLEWSIRILNVGVFEMEDFPFSVIENVYITGNQCWLLMIVIVLVIGLVKYRKFQTMLLIAACMIIFSVIQWNHFSQEIKRQQLIIYHVPGHSAMDMIDRGQAYFFADSVLLNDSDKIRFHISPNRLNCGVKKIYNGDQEAFARTFKGCRLMVWKNMTILQIYSRNFSAPEGTDFKYVIVGNNAIRGIDDLSHLKFERLILDSSNSFYFADKIIVEAQKAPFKTFSVLHQQAFVAKF